MFDLATRHSIRISYVEPKLCLEKPPSLLCKKTPHEVIDIFMQIRKCFITKHVTYCTNVQMFHISPLA